MKFDDIQIGAIVGVGRHERFKWRTRTLAREARVLDKQANRPDYPDREWSRKSNKVKVQYLDEPDNTAWLPSREVLGPWVEVKALMDEQKVKHSAEIRRKRDAEKRAEALADRLNELAGLRIYLHESRGSLRGSITGADVEKLIELLEAK